MKKLILTGCLILCAFGAVLASEGKVEGHDARACTTKGIQSLIAFPWPRQECPDCE